MLSISTRQAYAEIDSFIELLSDENKSKIPNELRIYFKVRKDYNYTKEINPDIPLKDQNLKRETLALIALLYLKYFCEDDAEKERLINIYKENETKQTEEIYEKLNNLNGGRSIPSTKEISVNSNINENNQFKEERGITEYKKESIIKSFFKKILQFFKAK